MRKFSSAFLALILCCIALPAEPSQAQTALDLEQLQRATVQITQVFTNPVGQTVISCIGSGTIVSADGLILTNAHVALPIAGCRSDRIVVALTVRIGEAPVPKYYAEVLAVNYGWDLAVLQVARTLDDRPVNREALLLPFVELGNSDEVALDQTVEFVGYAAPERDPTASSTTRVVRGTISGFTAEARVGQRAWLKTRAALPGSMSGGGAYDIQGRLIGIPTVEPPTSGLAAGSQENCRRIQDSNGDGRVDDNDLCVPVSGFVNALRPSRLARGLILAAQLEITPFSQQELPAQQPLSLEEVGQNVIGAPQFRRLFFATGVDLAGNPTRVIARAPAGINTLYLFFDYANMRDGIIYELRVLRDGVLDPTFSLAPATWSGGRSGMWYIGSTAQVYPNGNYEFILFIEGVRVANANITVGGGPTTEPEFSNILFGVQDLNFQLVNTGNILPVSNVINAEFVYTNMIDGISWRQAWYYEDLRISEVNDIWSGGSNGKRLITASAPVENPLQPGRYRLELYIEDRLAASSDFIMAGGQVDLSTEVFTDLTFASELRDGVPSGVIGVTFPNTITDLYAVFNWRDIAPGTPFTWRWTVDNNPLFEVTQPWTNPTTGSRAWLRLRPNRLLPEGSYKLELLIGSVVKASATARVGIGQLPIRLFVRAEGVLVQGQIVDAETDEGIAGVAVIFLKPLFDVADFTWQMSEVHDIAFTDLNGRFALSRLLERGSRYSIIVSARGYLPITTDGFRILRDEAGPIELRLELNRD
ncbi:MAG: trypsin-like peptidase domain-containing protein [Aggregatilineales bacterium]